MKERRKEEQVGRHGKEGGKDRTKESVHLLILPIGEGLGEN